jgi:hypothetical protein
MIIKRPFAPTARAHPVAPGSHLPAVFPSARPARPPAARLARRTGSQAQAAQRRLVLQTSGTRVAMGLQTSRTVVNGRLQPSGTRGGASTLRSENAEG